MWPIKENSQQRQSYSISAFQPLPPSDISANSPSLATSKPMAPTRIARIQKLKTMVTKIKIVLLFLFVLGLMSTHASSRLTPISVSKYWDKGVLTDYVTEINTLLLPSSYSFAYIVTPSFRPEYSLAGVADTLIIRNAEQKIWSIDKPNTVSIKEYKLQLSPAIIDSIGELFESAVLSSSYLSESYGCDGTIYVFISNDFTARCWSPIKGSNCRKLVDLADSICKAVELHDSNLIVRNLNSISELHQTFKALYDEKPVGNLILLDNNDGEYTSFRGYHFVEFLCITFIVFIIIGIVGFIILLCSKKRRKYWWIPLLAAILLCVTMYAIAHFYMTLNSISW